MSEGNPVSKVRQLKDALLDELLRQFETDAGTVTSRVMTVAAKIIKDFAHEAEENGAEAERIAKLSTYLEKRRAGRLQVVSG